MNSPTTPAVEPLRILPAMAPFTMGFRDVNKWVFRYPEASGDLERGINVHSFEDQTHSRLFLEDWRRVGLDDVLGWRASDTLWWMYLSEINEVARGHGVYFASMAVADRKDPLLRFAHSEMMEALGSVFFAHVSRIATRYSEETGIELPYMGPHHLALESGHMDCEDLFASQVLDGARRERALHLADTMYGIFADELDTWLRYAQEHLVPARPPRAPRTVPSGHRVSDAPVVRCRTDGPHHPDQAPLVALLAERTRRSAAHPFYTWLRHRGDRIDALTALRRFIPMWAMDVMGYRDLNRYALRYPDPADELQLAVNAWSDDLATHNQLFLSDWRALGLDDLLGWSGSETLAFCYLDPLTDVHRRNIVRFTELAVDHDDPRLRLWLMHALEASGQPFFRATRELAHEVEAVSDIRLDYLGDRHESAHRPRAGRDVRTVDLADRPLDAAGRVVVTQMITTVFDAADEQLDISLDVALSNKFDIS